MDLNEILKENPRLAEWHTNVVTGCQYYERIGLPNIVPGAMDEELGITWETYLDYCRTLYDELLDGLDDGEDIPAFSAPCFAEWREAERSNASEVEEFSTERCDCCGTTLAGARHKMTALPADPSTDERYTPLEVCQDCYLFLVNDDLPEDM